MSSDLAFQVSYLTLQCCHLSKRKEKERKTEKDGNGITLCRHIKHTLTDRKDSEGAAVA